MSGNRWQQAMAAALDEARQAVAHGDVPIGAVIVDAEGRIVARAHNERELTGDPTAHAEVLALRRAVAARSTRDVGTDSSAAVVAQAVPHTDGQSAEPGPSAPTDSPPTPDWRLAGHTLVVTLEPCTMCAGALVLARVDRVVFGAFDEKAGAIASLWDVVRDPRLNHRVEVVGGIDAEASASLLRDFFAGHRG